MEHLNGVQEEYIKVILEMIKRVEMDDILGVMENTIQDNLDRI